ncbi:MAG: DUF3726 domain-containing protein [Proteobacteria bacterium]|nr:DUF3726 domain-containing protein [Pseudomonadota bacterium]
MAYSLNEIEAICKKAAFGAGLPFGISEEAGKAARCLASNDLPGPELLAKLLSLYQQRPHSGFIPILNSETSFGASDTICPLMAGAVLTDRMKQAEEEGIVFNSLAYPLLLVPYVFICARSTGTSFKISFEDIRVETSKVGGFTITGPKDQLTRTNTKTATVSATGRKLNSQPLRNSCRNVDDESWHILNHLAHQKFAPATEASRSLGAG